VLLYSPIVSQPNFTSASTSTCCSSPILHTHTSKSVTAYTSTLVAYLDNTTSAAPPFPPPHDAAGCLSPCGSVAATKARSEAGTKAIRLFYSTHEAPSRSTPSSHKLIHLIFSVFLRSQRSHSQPISTPWSRGTVHRSETLGQLSRGAPPACPVVQPLLLASVGRGWNSWSLPTAGVPVHRCQYKCPFPKSCHQAPLPCDPVRPDPARHQRCAVRHSGGPIHPRPVTLAMHASHCIGGAPPTFCRPCGRHSRIESTADRAQGALGLLEKTTDCRGGLLRVGPSPAAPLPNRRWQ